MRRVSTAQLVPGMVTAEDVYNYNDSLILPKGLILTDRSITKLEFYSIINVRVEEEVVPVPEEELDSIKELVDIIKSDMREVLQKGGVN